MKTGWFIGRFQPFHEGHQTMIKSILKECDACTVLVRNVMTDEKNPYPGKEVKKRIEEWAKGMNVDVVLAPDLGCDMTVYYGREVGWDFKELRQSKDVEEISATKIREKEKKVSEQDTER